MGGNSLKQGIKDSFAIGSEDHGEAAVPLQPLEDYDVLSLKHMKEHDFFPYSFFFHSRFLC